MPCYHPLKAFHIGLTDNGKNKLKIVPYKVDHLEKIGDKWLYCDTEFRSSNCEKSYFEYDVIPCGQCIGCRLEYSRQWAIRCMIEANSHPHNWWLTLTYDDEHLPTADHINDKTGEIWISHSLIKSDVQRFIKNLRNSGKSFRYFGCGEYGEKTARPHYHLLIFSDDIILKDLVFYKRSGDFPLYTSDTISDFWRVPDPPGRKSKDWHPERIGYVIVSQVTFDTCAYTSRYVCKKLFGQKKEWYADYGLCPPFSLQSLKPAIARQFFDRGGFLPDSKLVLSDFNGYKSVKLPKYYERLFEGLDISCNNDLRKSLIEQRQAFFEAAGDRDLEALLKAEEDNKLSQIAVLRRLL